MMTPGTNPHLPRPTFHDIITGFGWAAFLFGIAILLSSCGTQKPVVTQQDSVRVEIRERVVRDTVSFTLPAAYIEKTVLDTLSEIETEHAKSTAAIRGGLLYHSLTCEPDTVRVPVHTTVRDTTIVEKEGKTVYVEVPRQPTKWESFLEVCGWILLGAIALAVLCLILRTVLRR